MSISKWQWLNSNSIYSISSTLKEQAATLKPLIQLIINLDINNYKEELAQIMIILLQK